MIITEYLIKNKWTTKVPKSYTDKLLKTRQVSDLKNVPNVTPYLSNSWDRMDEYHSLDSSKVTEKDFIQFFAIIFKKAKVKTFSDAQHLPEYHINSIYKCSSSGHYGCWQVDLWGGFFHAMGMYGQSFYLPFIPQELNKFVGSKKEELYERRFNWLQEKFKEIYG